MRRIPTILVLFLTVASLAMAVCIWHLDAQLAEVQSRDELTRELAKRLSIEDSRRMNEIVQRLAQTEQRIKELENPRPLTWLLKNPD
jgi:TolA-binding protein